MLYQVAQGCGISSGPGCFRAIELSDENACQVDVVVYSFNGGSGENLSVSLEGSNDGENWSATSITGSTITFAGGATPELGTKTGRFSGIAWRFVRANYTLGGTAKQASFVCVENTLYL